MKKVKLYLQLYYPVVLSFLSFLYSVSLWFSGYQLEGIFVGIWVPSILAFAICIRQRRNDYYRALAAQRRFNNKQRRRRR
jgi:nitrate reductase assembly molybdenum cofactor insertion protein NarJ|tara:strand:- start:149 stop:388 length:240 start_codon:yes stop_codon:yes gene_type:complete